MKASVRVMRSYDYCHFEATLSSDDDMTLDQVNELRKQAALLVDEAIRQYKLAKAAEGNREQKQYRLEHALKVLAAAKDKPKNELTPEEAALLRMEADREFWKEYEEDDFYYQDEPERDHHFSMLRRFQDVTIQA